MPHANTIKDKGGFDVDKKEQWEKAGNELRKIRKATGLSVFKVGRAIGVSGSYISQFERGSCAPSDATLIALADLYDVDKQTLFNLYKRIEKEEALALMENPELRKTFTEITSNKNLSNEDIDEITKEFQAIAQKYFNKEGK